jgi:hypothetical protein
VTWFSALVRLRVPDERCRGRCNAVFQWRAYLLVFSHELIFDGLFRLWTRIGRSENLSGSARRRMTHGSFYPNYSYLDAQELAQLLNLSEQEVLARTRCQPWLLPSRALLANRAMLRWRVDVVLCWIDVRAGESILGFCGRATRLFRSCRRDRSGLRRRLNFFEQSCRVTGQGDCEQRDVVH